MRIFERLQRAMNGFRLREGVDVSTGLIDDDEHLYRRLGDAKPRDLQPLKREKAVNIALYMYMSNPLAHRLTEDLKDWVVGSGIKVRHDNPELQDVLNAHWEDHVNNWNISQHEFVRDLGLFGELIMPTFVNEANGHVRFGVLDPGLVKRIEYDPENARIPISVIKRGKNRTDHSLSIVKEDENPVSSSYGRLIGETFLFMVNRTVSQGHGYPDLLAMSDFLNAYDQFMFDDMERTVLMKRFIFDLEIKGANKKILQERSDLLKNLKPGQVYAHNPGETLTSVSPNTQASDNAAAAKMYRSHVLGGAGWSEELFSGSDKVPSSSGGQSIGEAVLKRVASRQRFVEYMIRHEMKYVLDQWWIHNPEMRGRIDVALTNSDPVEVNKVLHSFDVIMPEPVARDMSKISDAILKLTLAAINALNNVEGELISLEDARKAVAVAWANFGVEIDPVIDDGPREEAETPGDRETMGDDVEAELGMDLVNRNGDS